MQIITGVRKEKIATTKDGDIFETSYLDENKNVVYPIDGEVYQFMGKVMKYSGRKGMFVNIEGNE